MNHLSFIKMHGLENDFVILDQRKESASLSPEQLQWIAHRKKGIGCDQIIFILPPYDEQADIFMRIFNANGDEVQACGNATRCVAHWMMSEKNTHHVVIETKAGRLKAEKTAQDCIKVDMGKPGLLWQDIPLSQQDDTLSFGLDSLPDFWPKACGVNMGNPHVIFFTKDPNALSLNQWGSHIENHPHFPEKTNVSVACVHPNHTIDLKVWERGSGRTKACGTAACAALVAAVRRKLCPPSARIFLEGGYLDIQWDQTTHHVLMTGSISYSFSGMFSCCLEAEKDLHKEPLHIKTY